MVQKKFYGSFESRKLSFFNIQMGGGLHSGLKNRSGKGMSVYHSRWNAIVGDPLVSSSRSPHK